MKLTLAGDTNLFGRAEPAEAFSAIAPLLTGHDILFGHAEGMYTTETRELPFKMNWRHSPPESIRGFVDAGFDGVSFASNVCAERQAVLDTIENAERVRLPFCGIGRTITDARQPLVIEKPAGRVAFLSRTSVFWPPLVPASDDLPGAATVKAHTAYVPGRRAAEMPGSPPEIHTWPDPRELDLLLSDIQAVRRDVDRLVLSIHWGISSCDVVQQYQRAIAHAAIDAGVDLVMGHHPHVVQEIELYKGRPIFYSMGNFAFDLPKMHGRLREGLLVHATFDADTVRCTVTPVQRNAENLISELPAADPAWSMVTRLIQDRATPTLRDHLRLDANRLVF